MSRRVMVVGVGKRWVEVARPAFERAAGIEVVDVRARRARTGDPAWAEIRAVDEIDAGALAAVDLVYVAVPKPAVPSVLERLARLDRSGVDQLIETPVQVFKQFRHAGKLRGWRNVWVSEDCRWLPWIDAALAAVGPVSRVEFAHSAWKYHGFALLKTLLGDPRVRRARSTGSGEERRRVIEFAGGGVGVVLEPRDYATGSFTIEGAGGRLTDAVPGDDDTLRLTPTVADGAVTGFECGAVSTTLDEDEVAVQRVGARPPDDARVTRRTEDMKRVGFLRLLRSIAAGRGAYPLAQGVDDMLVDYLLDKAGRVGALSAGAVKRLTRLPR